MRIGMVVAVEIDAVLERYGEPQRMEKHGEFTVRVYNVHGSELIIAHSGVGEISAAACTQLLISVYGAEMILNFGVVGGFVYIQSICFCKGKSNIQRTISKWKV